MTYEFLITSLVVILLPGTGVIYTLALGIGGGFRAGLLAAFGCTLGIVPHILASVVGLAALLHASALAFEVLRYIGVAYLLFIAWSLVKESKALDLRAEQAPAGKAFRIVRKGVLTNILNPKLSLFFLAFLPQFVRPERGRVWLQFLLLGLLLSMIGFAHSALLSVAVGRLGRRVRLSASRWKERVLGAFFVGLGVRLALQQRG